MKEKSKPKLLFITQKIHQDDDDLAFVILWIREFIRQGIDVQVICLQKGNFDDSFPVYSLGKELGLGKLARTLRFLKLIATLDYNRVFVHMNPEYITLGGWYWFLRGIPMYLWYTHYTMHVHLWLSGILCKRMFAATAQSLPQYEGNLKKVIVGHGIDVAFWNTLIPDEEPLEKSLVYINRLSRSKRVELAMQALVHLPQDYTLSIYGRIVPGEESYYEELKEIAEDERFGARVFFRGSIPMSSLKKIYPQHRLMVNMAMETIDKTMLEGMLFGVYPVTTPANSRAIGLPVWPKGETPQDLADFIKSAVWNPYGKDELKKIVEERHSLPALIKKMNVYIREGN